MPFINWIEDEDAVGDLAEFYRWYKEANPHKERIPGILKCFSLRPDFLRRVMQFSDEVHFSEGHLTVRTKEMIATLVSALNGCTYCTGSHAVFLREQGAADDIAEALARRDIEGAPVTQAERQLLRFVKLVTESACRVTQEETQMLRDVGWSDPQIAEAVYIAALLGFFNRVADTFGLGETDYSLLRSARPDTGSEL